MYYINSVTNEKICTRTHFDKRMGNSEETYTIYQIKTINVSLN